MARWRTICFCIFLASFGASPSGAEFIDFEDLAPSNSSQLLVSDEYVHLGAEFFAGDDGATWGGVAAGDPGGWQITGSQGSTFLGFDGQSYAISLLFDTPVEDFEIDAARAAGALPFFVDTFSVTGFLDGQIVGSKAVFFGGVDDWKTVLLPGKVDKVTWFGTGLLGHRYGVDNLRWSEAVPEPPEQPEMLEVAIDVRPGTEKNRIQMYSSGLVTLVLYGEVDFAVEDVDVHTLAFGPAEAAVAHSHGPHPKDVDDDGWLDLVLHHRVPELGIAADDTEACLTGETLDGMAFEGCDFVAPR